MKKHLLSILCFVVAVCALAGPATAAPIVQNGTTYTFYLEGSESDNAFIGQTIFDDVAATTTRAGLLLTVSESELALGDGRSRIRVNVTADGDLFPSLGETAILAIGADGDGFDLLRKVRLDEVRITFSGANGSALFVSDNLAGDVTERDPWTGFFPAPENAVVFNGIGGQGTRNISFDFFVSEIPADVPEPSTVLLGMIGLAGALVARRRQRKPAQQA